jgi:hypothetical protein
MESCREASEQSERRRILSTHASLSSLSLLKTAALLVLNALKACMRAAS